MDPAQAPPPPLPVHPVAGGGTWPELALLLRSLAAAGIVALDAEWKPRRRARPAPAGTGDRTSPATAAKRGGEGERGEAAAARAVRAARRDQARVQVQAGPGVPLRHLRRRPGVRGREPQFHFLEAAFM
ncbi:unnamed protein product [Urochloa humidicola]